MAQSKDKLREQVAQLNAARNLVLGDAALYPQIVNGVLPIIGAQARLELRRWGAEFLAETFASPSLDVAQKEQLAPRVLQTLQELLELPERDPTVLKGVVQSAASLYPILFRLVINKPENPSAWERMTTVKQDLLRRMDSSPYPVRICCIKFAQRVVQAQTPGLISDPRRPDKNETSLSLVPRNHAVLSLANLEAEASGLLDRLLSVFQENSGDPLLVNATLNCLAVLVRTRPSISNKIISTVLEFDPLKQVSGPLTPVLRVNIKSMERTIKALLVNIMKRNPSHTLAGKMQHHVERLLQSRLEMFDEPSRKRGLPVEPTDGLDNAKRARLDAETPPIIKIPPLPPGPNSYAQLYSLTDDVGLTSFDVKQLPSDLVVKITVPVLGRIDPSLLQQAVDGIRSRYQVLSQQAAQARLAAMEEDEDYEPEYQPMDISDQVSSPASQVAAEVAELQPELMSLGPFVLPQPPPLTEAEAGEVGRSAAFRVFSMLASVETAPQSSVKAPGGAAPPALGFSRLAGSTFDKDAWALLLVRIATRAPAGLEPGGRVVEFPQSGGTTLCIADSIRETLYRYVVEDFRTRINVGITWLNEEWFNDRIQSQFANTMRSTALDGGKDEEKEADDNDDDDDDDYDPGSNSPGIEVHYDRYVLRVLDGILPYLDARDLKILVRFLSEIPDVTMPIAQRVASLAQDPERITLCVQALLYLIMFRPPAREICLQTLEYVYKTHEESRPAAGKILAKWRPSAMTPPQPSAGAGASAGTGAAMSKGAASEDDPQVSPAAVPAAC